MNRYVTMQRFTSYWSRYLAEVGLFFKANAMRMLYVKFVDPLHSLAEVLLLFRIGGRRDVMHGEGHGLAAEGGKLVASSLSQDLIDLGTEGLNAFIAHRLGIPQIAVKIPLRLIAGRKTKLHITPISGGSTILSCN